jgi:GNAT superfamily N-acetyltransferase
VAFCGGHEAGRNGALRTRALGADVELSPASRAEKPVIASYLQEYLAGFGFRGEYPYFDQYWLEPTRHPFLITCGEERVGFAFVRSIDGGATHEISEFYVLPEYRGAGIGRAAVRALSANLSGAVENSRAGLQSPRHRVLVTRAVGGGAKIRRWRDRGVLPQRREDQT